jgi:hypothetical protein
METYRRYEMITRTQFRNLKEGNFLSYPSGEELVVYDYVRSEGDWKCFYLSGELVRLRFRQGGDILLKGKSQFTNSLVRELMGDNARVGTYKIH